MDRFLATLEFFSVGQLLRTLFAPFRQISASTTGDGSFGSAMRAFLDRCISRLVGTVVRLFTILAGLCVIVLQSMYEVCIMLAWWFLPLLPIAGLIMLAIGWAPVWA